MKVTPSKPKSVITMNTKDPKNSMKMASWWKASSDRELCGQLLTTAAFLKETQAYRHRQAAMYARLYGNMSLFNFIGSNMTKMEQSTGLPTDRPTFNLIQSATDTQVSRISQSRPQPVFLTDNSDYKERNLAKKLNNFLQGEFYQTKTYEKAAIVLRDALVEGTGCLHVYPTMENKVGVERVLLTELMIDPNEGIYGEPRTLYRLKLVDRAVLKEMCPKYKAEIDSAEQAFPDNGADSSKTVSDLVMVVEAWRLPSGPKATDGRHTIACTAGILLDEKYTKQTFPFAFLHYSPRLLGFWAQGLAEQLMGTQMEINSLLFTITRAIKLVGVPRIFQEASSKVNKASHNNDIGTIISYTGIKPSYEVAQCVPQELYAQLQRLIDYGYQQSGVSAMQASSQKPAGLNSGEAIRSYDDIATDRSAALARRYDNVFIDLAYLMIDVAKDICEEEGSYSTIYPDKNGTKEIKLPKLSLLKNSFVIQCFNMSSLPREPAGRMQKVTEMIQSGMITVKEGRRLLDYPDLEQVERLANASEERILQILDRIVEGLDEEDDADDELESAYTPPDPFMDLELATQLVTQYINLYSQYNLEEEKMQQLRDFASQIQTIKQAAMPPAPVAGPTPQAVPQAPAVSDLIPNAPKAV